MLKIKNHTSIISYERSKVGGEQALHRPGMG